MNTRKKYQFANSQQPRMWFEGCFGGRCEVVSLGDVILVKLYLTFGKVNFNIKLVHSRLQCQKLVRAKSKNFPRKDTVFDSGLTINWKINLREINPMFIKRKYLSKLGRTKAVEKFILRLTTFSTSRSPLPR